MKQRPLLLTILCIVLFLEPLSKILYLKLSTGFDISLVFENVFQISRPKDFFDFWIAFPLAGLALIKIRSWSYTLFMAMQVYSLVAILTYEKHTWPYVSSSPMFTSIAIVIFNLFLIMYFLLPDVRRPFFDKKARWWEPKTRYRTNIPCVIDFSSTSAIPICTIHNISQTGAFLFTSQPILNESEITVDFKVLDEHFFFKAEVVGNHIIDGVEGFGIKFKINGINDYLKLRKLITHISITSNQ
ncbi:MAG: PilZ domain-containing protein [Bacteriovoracaceae bacterium]|nr:PilZ domain-containing protein [Bacteriovoracaceae bacterium]